MQDLDLWSLAVLLHDHQQVYPPSCLLAPALVDSALPERFCDQLRQAQAADPQLADIKAQLEAPTGPPPVFRLLSSIVDNMVIVAEADGRRRIVVPETHYVWKFANIFMRRTDIRVCIVPYML